MPPVRRSTRIQPSQSAKPSHTPRPSRKPKRTVSASNPTPRTSRGRPPTRSSGPQLQQVSTMESQKSPLDTTARRLSAGSPRNKNIEERSFTNSPGESSQLLSADTATHSGTALATTSEQPLQDLEPLQSGPSVSDRPQTLSVFQHSSGPNMEEDQPLSIPSSVSMSIRNGPDSLPSAYVP